MPLKLITGDITKQEVDAVVNAANQTLLGGGGVDGMIHRAAGPELLEECRKLGGCKTGEAKITKGYNLPAKYVIHTVGPIYKDGTFNEEAELTACYKNSLALAVQYKCSTVAFPVISSGAYGYPFRDAVDTAIAAITDFLDGEEFELTVFLVFYDQKYSRENDALYRRLRKFVNENYLGPDADNISGRSVNLSGKARMIERKANLRRIDSSKSAPPAAMGDIPRESASSTFGVTKWQLEHDRVELGESFISLLDRLISATGKKNSEIYKKANLTKSHFAKIKNGEINPSKKAVLALAFALELSIDSTVSFLEAAGYSLSRSIYFDTVCAYVIKNRKEFRNIVDANIFLDTYCHESLDLQK